MNQEIIDKLTKLIEQSQTIYEYLDADPKDDEERLKVKFGKLKKNHADRPYLYLLEQLFPTFISRRIAYDSVANQVRERQPHNIDDAFYSQLKMLKQLPPNDPEYEKVKKEETFDYIPTDSSVLSFPSQFSNESSDTPILPSQRNQNKKKKRNKPSSKKHSLKELLKEEVKHENIPSKKRSYRQSECLSHEIKKDGFCYFTVYRAKSDTIETLVIDKWLLVKDPDVRRAIDHYIASKNLNKEYKEARGRIQAMKGGNAPAIDEEPDDVFYMMQALANQEKDQVEEKFYHYVKIKSRQFKYMDVDFKSSWFANDIENKSNDCLVHALNYALGCPYYQSENQVVDVLAHQLKRSKESILKEKTLTGINIRGFNGTIADESAVYNLEEVTKFLENIPIDGLFKNIVTSNESPLICLSKLTLNTIDYLHAFTLKKIGSTWWLMDSRLKSIKPITKENNYELQSIHLGINKETAVYSFRPITFPDEMQFMKYLVKLKRLITGTIYSNQQQAAEQSSHGQKAKRSRWTASKISKPSLQNVSADENTEEEHEGRVQ